MFILFPSPGCAGATLAHLCFLVLIFLSVQGVFFFSLRSSSVFTGQVVSTVRAIISLQIALVYRKPWHLKIFRLQGP
jgi:hypothetical protein